MRQLIETTHATHQSAQRTPARVFALLAAVCVAVLLVGSLLFVLRLAHQSQGQNPPQTGSGGPQGIYASDSTSVFKLDPQTHQALWQREIKSASKIISAGKTVYVLQSAMDAGNTTNVVLELDASNGQTLWTHVFPPPTHNNQQFVRDMLLAQGRLYVGWQRYVNSGDPGKGRQGMAQIYVFNASNGSQITSYTVTSSLWLMNAGNGVLAASVESGLRVYDLATGKQLWTKTFLASTTAPVLSLTIVNGLVYAVVVADNGRSPDTSTIRVYRASSGEQVWQGPAFGSDQLSTLRVDGNIVYFGVTLSPKPPQDAPFTAKDKKPTTGHVYAYDIQSNKQLWKTPVAGATLHSLVLSNNMLYLAVDSGVVDNPDPQPAQVVAIDAATGRIKWQQTLAANYIGGFCLSKGTIYASTYNLAKSAIAWNQTYALAASNGNTQWKDSQHSFFIIVPG